MTGKDEFGCPIPWKCDLTSKFQPWKWNFQRQTCAAFGKDVSHMIPSLYSNMKASRVWDPQKTSNHTHHRGIFNFDFSPDGKILIAACEGGSLLSFDPLNAQLINYKNKAHTDCVNCVRFLDSRLFTTCSDDTTVALWDARFLKNKVRSMSGHLSWVKNIEYDNKNGLLLTSGFDGCIYTWDINNYSETDPGFKHVFHTSGLMRSKLSSDCSKLVISLSRGYIIVIHDLDLLTLETDLYGFKPNMYRLIQMSGEMPIRLEHLDHYNKYFHRKRNRVEFITDFPVDIEAEVIASLQIHPQGWCILSRSTTSNERSEWTCVHDIQNTVDVCGQKGTVDNDDCETANKMSKVTSSSRGHHPLNNSCLLPLTDSSSHSELTVNGTTEGHSSTSNTEDTFDEDFNESSEDEREAHQGSVQIDMAIFEELFSSSPSPRQSVAASTDSRLPTTIRIPATTSHPERLVLNRAIGESEQEVELSSHPLDAGVSGVDRSSPGHSSDSPSGAGSVEYLTLRLPRPSRKRKYGMSKVKNSIIKNTPRLLCYAEECNVGRGFIKELCFSSDGRVICSPFGYGVRLMSFNRSCAELCDCVPESPVKLYEIATAVCHSNVVVTTKFSPVHSLLVTGCLNGKATFCQPVF